MNKAIAMYFSAYLKHIYGREKLLKLFDNIHFITDDAALNDKHFTKKTELDMSGKVLFAVFLEGTRNDNFRVDASDNYCNNVGAIYAEHIIFSDEEHVYTEHHIDEYTGADDRLITPASQPFEPPPLYTESKNVEHSELPSPYTESKIVEKSDPPSPYTESKKSQQFEPLPQYTERQQDTEIEKQAAFAFPTLKGKSVSMSHQSTITKVKNLAKALFSKLV